MQDVMAHAYKRLRQRVDIVGWLTQQVEDKTERRLAPYSWKPGELIDGFLQQLRGIRLHRYSFQGYD
jgi:hypothetical protein